MPVAYAIDANVILRYTLRDEPRLFAKAEAVILAMEAGEITLECDPVTLSEVVFVLSSVYGTPRQHIADALLPLVKSDGFRVTDKDRYILALEWFGQGALHFGDACACATAELKCQGRLVSFDRALSRVPGIERVEAVDTG